MLMLVAQSYPDEIRTTGVGWTLAAGHLGAVISPAIVAIPLGHDWTPAHIMLLPVIPAFVCAIAILYAAPPAVGDKTTSPQQAVKTAAFGG
jgi:MFS transporter, AAHS family, 4-hydroxybenzoate transporter